MTLSDHFEPYDQDAFTDGSKGGRGSCSTVLCPNDPAWMRSYERLDGTMHRAFCEQCAKSAAESYPSDA